MIRKILNGVIIYNMRGYLSITYTKPEKRDGPDTKPL
jgi:hypothetical protein